MATNYTTKVVQSSRRGLRRNESVVPAVGQFSASETNAELVLHILITGPSSQL